MSRNVFGWSYPPGAATDPNAPYNQVDNVTKLQEDVWALLEKAGFSDTECNNVMSVIQDVEQQQRDDDMAALRQHEREYMHDSIDWGDIDD